METKNRLGGADGVRALACLMVMAHHAFQRLALPAQTADVQALQQFFLTGSAGVGAFFVLSGYLLSTPFWRAWSEGQSRPSLATYSLRRWARIAPGFWLNLTLTFGLSWFLVPDAPNRVWRFLAGLTFTSSLTWETLFPVEINGPLWSIGFEVFSYVLLAGFLFLWFLVPGKRTTARGMAWWLGVLALSLVGHSLWLALGQTDLDQKGWQYGLSGGAKYWWPAYNPIGFFASFVFGVLGAGITDRLGRKAHLVQGGRRWLWDGVVAWALVGWVALMWSLRREGEFGFSWPTMPYYFPSFALMVTAVLAFGPHTVVVARLLDNPVARFLATISFGLYIWHYLLLETSNQIWPNMKYFGITDPWEWAWKVALVYTAAGLVATLSWYGFERPIVRWSQRQGARRA